MNRKEQQIVDEIISLWISFADKNDRINAVARESQTTMQKLVDHRGDLPESSAYKPETISKRVERIKGINITHDEKRAHNVLMSFCERSRLIICTWPAVRRQHNPKTGKPFTLQDVALVCGFLHVEPYAEMRACLCEELVRRWHMAHGMVA